MNPGDTVQILQTDHARLQHGAEPTPVSHWVYATVLEPLANDKGMVTAASVEVNHPGNIEHGQRKVVGRKFLRTVDDLHALHAKHPHHGVERPSYDNPEHKELINLRAAIARCTPSKEEPA